MGSLEVGVCYSKAPILLQSRKANSALTFTSSEIQLLNIYSSSINMNNIAIILCSFPINFHEFLYQY